MRATPAVARAVLRCAIGHTGCVSETVNPGRLPAHPVPLDPGAAVAHLVAELAAGRRLVLVDGLSASGKSTLAAAVVAATGTPVAVVRGDDFIRRGTTEWDRARFVRDVLVPLSRGDDAAYRPWPWDAVTPAGWVSVPAGSGVILEGVAVSDLDPRDVPVGDPLIVWVETPEPERVRRALARAPHRFACWRDDWLPLERAWAERSRPWERAHLVVTT